MQMIFLFEKRLQIKGSELLEVVGIKELLKKGPVVSEPPIYADALFGQARLEGSPTEMRQYMDFYEGIISEKNFLKPDLIFYLRLSLPNFFRRIRKRAEKDPERKVELQEKEEYWKRLHDLHEEWVRENPLNLRIITIDGDKFDFSRYKNQGEANTDLLTELLIWMKYYESKIPGIIIPETITNYVPRPKYRDKLPFDGLR
jgi:deoxyadenosine/deoxycytidine kinase